VPFFFDAFFAVLAAIVSPSKQRDRSTGCGVSRHALTAADVAPDAVASGSKPDERGDAAWCHLLHGPDDRVDRLAATMLSAWLGFGFSFLIDEWWLMNGDGCSSRLLTRSSGLVVRFAQESLGSRLS
jgi:hypothetical protein